MYDKFVDQKLGNHLPDDLVFSILFKLPLKSLKRYGCLNKSWAFLLENYNFMELFRINFISNQHSYYDDTSHLLCLDQLDKSSLFSLSGMSFQNIENKFGQRVIVLDILFWVLLALMEFFASTHTSQELSIYGIHLAMCTVPYQGVD